MDIIPAAKRADRRSFCLTLAGLATLAAVADEAVASSSMLLRSRYAMNAAGAQIAAVQIDQKVTDGWLVEMSLAMKNTGILAWWNPHRLEMRTQFAPDASLRPIRFTSYADKPDRNRWVRVDYDPAGDVVLAEVDNDGRKRRSHVPHELWRHTIDPLTALARLQRWAPSAQLDQTLVMPLFDGRKRADLHVRKLEPALAMELSLLAIFGFEEDEDGYVSWPGEAPSTLTLLLDGGDPPVPALLQADQATWSQELRLQSRKTTTI